MNERTMPYFGPGGNCEAFYASGAKATKDAPAWVRSVGLNAYEYEAGRGVSVGESVLKEIGQAAIAADIHMSLHAPYFISLSGTDPDTRLKSISYIEKSLWAADLLGADTIVVHCGSCAKITREEAMRLSADTLEKTLATVGHPDIIIGIETMGKKNQLGTLGEVIELCKMDARLRPVVDFGHLNARDCGGAFRSTDDYRRVFDQIGEALGDDVARNLHCHFSKIEWTDAGEKRHLTFEDNVYGPAYEPLMEALFLDALTPTIICESAGSQAYDALKMKECYEEVLKK